MGELFVQGVWGYSNDNIPDFGDDLRGYHGAFLFYDGHPAYDYDFDTDDVLLATRAGRISLWDPDTGRLRIDHHNGYFTEYRHCSGTLVSVNDNVLALDQVATPGAVGTGLVHLHLEILKDVNWGEGETLVSVDPYGTQYGTNPGTKAVRSNLWREPFQGGGGGGFLTLDVQNGAALPGVGLTLPVSSSLFTDVSAFDLTLQADTDFFSWQGADSQVLDGMIATVNGSALTLSWSAVGDPVTLPNGSVAFDLSILLNLDASGTGLVAWVPAECTLWDGEGQIIANPILEPGLVSIQGELSVSGSVVYLNTEAAIPVVAMQLDGVQTLTTETDELGTFVFNNLASDVWTLTGTRELEDRAAVSVADCIKINRHIAQLEVFDTPYKSSAADVNLSGSVSIGDVVSIRRYIAQLDVLDSGNWSFIDGDYEISADNWPDAPQAMYYQPLNQSLIDQDFVGVRHGDVNASWATPIADDESDDTAILEITSMDAIPGEEILVPVTLSGVQMFSGIELHLTYPDSALNIINFTSQQLNQPLVNSMPGELHVVWEEWPAVIQVDSLLGFLQVQAGQTEATAEISISHAVIADNRGDIYPTIYHDGMVVISLSTDVLDANSELITVYQLREVYPNPFNARMNISIALPENAMLSVKLYNLLGQQVATLVSRQVNAGLHTFHLDGSNLATGLYFIHATVPGKLNHVQKVMLVR